jgi:replication factor A1
VPSRVQNFIPLAPNQHQTKLHKVSDVMDWQLTKGICEKLMTIDVAATDDELYQTRPIVQLLSVKRINPAGSGVAAATDRYRVIVSDGVHFIQAMLATQLNNLVDEEKVVRNCIVQLEGFTVNVVQNRRCAPIN